MAESSSAESTTFTQVSDISNLDQLIHEGMCHPWPPFKVTSKIESVFYFNHQQSFGLVSILKMQVHGVYSV